MEGEPPYLTLGSNFVFVPNHWKTAPDVLFPAKPQCHTCKVTGTRQNASKQAHMSNIILFLSSVIFPFPQFVLLGLSSSHMETLCQTDAFSPDNMLRKQKDREQTGGRVKEKEKKTEEADGAPCALLGTTFAQKSRGYVNTYDVAIMEAWRRNGTDSHMALSNLSAVLITLGMEL